MKKLIFLLVLMIVFATGKAQTTIDILKGEQGQTYKDYLTAVTLTNTTAKALYFYMKPDYYTAVDCLVQLDSATGNHTNVGVALYGRIFEKQTTWTQIGSTVNWKGLHASAGVDTAFMITTTAETAYCQYKLLFTGTGTGTTTILYTGLKLWNGLP